jgi:hypothetical protein
LVCIGGLFVLNAWTLWKSPRGWKVFPDKLELIGFGRITRTITSNTLIRLEWKVVGSHEDTNNGEVNIYQIVAVLRGSRDVVLLEGVPEYLYAEVCALLLQWLGAEHLLAASGAMRNQA